MEIITKSAQETKNLGKKLAGSLKNGSTIALYGELGSGKTTFVKGLAKGLGVKERIISPTFIFIRPYTLVNRPNTLYHVDLYRIEKADEIKGLGVEELFADKKAIVAIEWAEKMKKFLPRKRIEVYFEYLGDNKRRIKIR